MKERREGEGERREQVLREWRERGKEKGRRNCSEAMEKMREEEEKGTRDQ